jgi:hypothetical protein
MISTLDLLAWLGFIAVLWIVRELILGLWAWRKARRFDHVLKVERTRGQFAVVRNRLSGLAAHGKIKPDSATYERLYLLNTVFMRSPDRYPELGKALRQAIFGSQPVRPNAELLQESKSWSPEVRDLVRQTADAMQQVLIDYSWFFRLYFHAASRQAQRREKKTKRPNSRNQEAWRFPEQIGARIRTIAKKIVAQLEKRNPVVFEIRKAQDVMYHMAQ